VSKKSAQKSRFGGEERVFPESGRSLIDFFSSLSLVEFWDFQTDVDSYDSTFGCVLLLPVCQCHVLFCLYMFKIIKTIMIANV
jgi:hypothetical protein